MDQNEMLDELAQRIQQMQNKAQKIAAEHNRSMPLRRGFHAKGIGVVAKFKINSNLPPNLQVGFFQPNTEYEALVRYSNARGEVLSDLAKDQRGMAIRIKTIQGEVLLPDDYLDIQDFLMSSTPISFARSPVQFIEVGEFLLGSIPSVIMNLIKKYGFTEARRILSVFLAPLISFKPLQMNQYWSRTSYKFGDTSIRYLIRPSAGSKTQTFMQQFTGVLRSVFQEAPGRDNYMQAKLIEALQEGDLNYDFCVQLFVDEKRTPIEDAYIEWLESDSLPIPIASLTIPKQKPDPQLQKEMEATAFNPWHTKDLIPLGLINLARKKVYDASAKNRGSSLKPFR